MSVVYDRSVHATDTIVSLDHYIIKLSVTRIVELVNFFLKQPQKSLGGQGELQPPSILLLLHRNVIFSIHYAS